METDFNTLMQAIYNIVNVITQKHLFRRFPGNHYNFSCRSYIVCDLPGHSKIARQRSNLNLMPRPKYNIKYIKSISYFAEPLINRYYRELYSGEELDRQDQKIFNSIFELLKSGKLHVSEDLEHKIKVLVYIFNHQDKYINGFKLQISNDDENSIESMVNSKTYQTLLSNNSGGTRKKRKYKKHRTLRH